MAFILSSQSLQIGGPCTCASIIHWYLLIPVFWSRIIRLSVSAASTHWLSLYFRSVQSACTNNKDIFGKVLFAGIVYIPSWTCHFKQLLDFILSRKSYLTEWRSVQVIYTVRFFSLFVFIKLLHAIWYWRNTFICCQLLIYIYIYFFNVKYLLLNIQ